MSICDLYLAAAIVTAGIRTTHTSTLSRRVYFHFPKDEGLLTRIKQDYMARSLQIDALSYADQIKSMKALCAELIKTGNNHISHHG